jgi:glutamyl-tRNA synthetase
MMSKAEQNPSPQYDHSVRLKMKNSLTLEAAEVEKITGYRIQDT